jgi:lipid-binding SYLF domain-containing protein
MQPGVLLLIALFSTFVFSQAQSTDSTEGAKKDQAAQTTDEGKGKTEQERITASADVLKEIFDTPDKGIPKDLVKGATCVVVLPSVKKAAFGIGATYGRGVMTCRTGKDYKGPWSAPVMMASSGGNIGFQIGGEATDFVILVMNDGGAKSLMKSKVKLGADASIAAGPVGRTSEASTNERMQAQMLSYSRARGVFGGISLSGATLRPDGSANENLYGKKVSAEEIIAGKVSPPKESTELVAQLQRGQSVEASK